ncbi:MAG: hypothetical protein ACHQYP_12820 [Nitrospiria bacterium]
MQSSGNRLNIHSEKEIQDLHDLPHMSYEKGVKYFSLISAEKKELSSFRL